MSSKKISYTIANTNAHNNKNISFDYLILYLTITFVLKINLNEYEHKKHRFIMYIRITRIKDLQSHNT